jgi:hypothetical protein
MSPTIARPRPWPGRDSSARRAGGAEAIEQLGRHAGAVVLHAEGEPCRLRIGHHRHPHPRTRPLAGVVEQVAEELQHVLAVHRPGALVRLQLDTQAAPGVQALQHLDERAELDAQREAGAARAAAGEAGAAQLALDGRAHGFELGADRRCALLVAARGEHVRALAEHRKRRLEGVGEIARGVADAPEALCLVARQALDRGEQRAHLDRRVDLELHRLTALQPPAGVHRLVQRRQPAQQHPALQHQQHEQRQPEHGQRLRAEGRDRGIDRGDVLGERDAHHATVGAVGEALREHQ